MTITLFGRQLVTRAAPRRYVSSPAPVLARVGLFETSGDVDNCAARTDNLIQGLDADLVAAFTKRYGSNAALLSQKMLFTGAAFGVPQPKRFPDDKAFYEAWRGFRQTFLDWRKDWDDQWVSILSADAYRECGKYDLEAKDWYDRFVKYGIKPTGPKTTTPSALPGILPDTPPNGQTPKGPLDDLITLVKWGVAGALVVGVIIAVR